MTSSVIAIILISAFMHAGWNLIARSQPAESAFYTQILVSIIVICLVPALISEMLARSLTPTAWLCVLGSGTSAALYLFALARAFESSDFTIVYPVARALPVIFVAIIDVLRGRLLTPFGWAGILLVAAGCLFVPLQSFSDFSPRRYFNRTSLWMLIAALGTVGYTMLDKIAAETVQQSAATAARYGIIYFSVSFLPYVGLSRLFSKRGSKPKYGSWKLAVLAGAMTYGAYWLVLWAYQLSPYASYIVAFRQFSIVIGALLAFLIFKERGVIVRLLGASFITGGLVLIAVLGR